MTKSEVEILVERGCRLDREIKAAEKELGMIKESLVTAARSMPGAPTKNGRAVTVAGNGGVATVSFPGPSLVRELTEETIEGARQKAGDAFAKLFAKVFRPVQSFRDVAAALLGQAKGGALVEFLEVESSPRVSFKAVDAPPR